ncbi:P-loop containing nucleoside triphosphate hydrolase protein, partial [Lojkania enalia]
DFSATQPGDEIHLNVTKLPHRALDGLWESLIYEDAIPESVLRVLIRMLKVSRVPHLNPAIISWQNLVLLYGPPGSGKTTLAQALAQKLSIRSTNIYSATKLIEVNSHTLLSKWFGESSKLVGRLFDTISSTSSDDSVLTIVIIDEVETLAGSREKATQANECGDAIRSTNELLQGLDRLRKRPNVIFLCTSNLKEIMDTAFIDRCGIKQYIDSPNVECAYEIFRSVINEFIKNHLVCFDSMLMDRVLPMSDAGVDEVDEELLGGSSPTLSSNSELRTLARKAEGLSGRTLRRLPMLALAKYTVDEPCELQNLLGALKRVVEEENQ